jgi:isoamylase
MQVWPGHRYPLGAIYDGMGTNFAVFSEVADAVELCLFDADGAERRVPLPEVDAFVFHAYLPGIEPGQRYGYRVHGPYDPARGQRCNPHKLLIDPYARAIDGDITWDPALYGYEWGDPERMSTTDSAPFLPKSVVVNPYFDWGNDRPPRVAYHNSIIYEAHVKGLTMRHPEVPDDLRGTYAGIAHPAIIEHLKSLDITAIELLPVHHFVHDHRLTELGMSNYWGYNSIGYFAPYHGYAATGRHGQQVQEFRAMVKALHAAGIEVILDVVYNHTAEGNHLGPTLCFKGIDNAHYYRLDDADPRHYTDYTGCGNSLNVRSPHTLQLVMDSLRYWVQEMHVDGFRFDLAPTLAREGNEVARLSVFFEVVQQDPVLNQVKLIAEPWDIGPGGYQVGNFPPQWTEWNGKYRDTVRDFWRTQPSTMAEFASRICGSADLYQDDGRRPFASINFVTCHDGFTLNDLVSYNDKHNEANGEDNRDGDSHNRSWNHGAEGPTDDRHVLELRARQRRNYLATLLLSQGVPMIGHGDELGRTQRGNNNAYCQDNELAWVDWENIDEQLLAFTRRVTAMRTAHRVFRRRKFFTGRPVRRSSGTALPDLGWFGPDGQEMTMEDWGHGFGHSVMLFVNGEGIRERGPQGERRSDDSFILIFNAHWEPTDFVLPGPEYGQKWQLMLNTAEVSEKLTALTAGDKITVVERSLVVLERTV